MLGHINNQKLLILINQVFPILSRTINRAIPLYLIILGTSSIIISGSVNLLAVIRFPLINLILPNNDIYYVGYPLSFITYGIITGIFYFKYKNMMLPLFILNYATWEIISQGVTPIGNTRLLPFIGILIMCIPSAILIYKRTNIKPSLLALILFWVISNQLFNPYDFYAKFPQLNLSEMTSESLWAFLTYRSIELK